LPPKHQGLHHQGFRLARAIAVAHDRLSIRRSGITHMSDFNISRRALLANGAALAVGGLTAPALAQTAPAAPPAAAAATGKTIQFILPNAVASGVDTITRSAQNELAKALGAAIVVNNQPGAGGIIGTQQMIRSAPDGLTLSIVSNNHVIYPSVLKTVPFDPIADITAIATLGSTPLVLVVNPTKLDVKTAGELTALLKSKPDVHSYGSSGNGTILHLGAAMYVDQAGVKMTHVPYKGVGPMLNDLIGGQVDMGVLAYPSIIAHLKSGALRAIGVCTPQRLEVAPDMPTFVEQGMTAYVVEAWLAVIGPAKMAADDVKRIHAGFVTAFNSDEVKTAMAKQANTIKITSPEQAAEFMKVEFAKYAAVVKKIGLEPQ
jgi:tripartite-type tricarboxylate transporter receptor subunit TctC